MRTPLPHPTGGVRLKPNDVHKLHCLGRQRPGSTDGESERAFSGDGAGVSSALELFWGEKIFVK